MEARDTFSLTWCDKHKNWWVTNCPDCMLDSNEEDIKKVGMRQVVEWMKDKMEYERCDPDVMAYFLDYVWVGYAEWQAKLKEWGLQ